MPKGFPFWRAASKRTVGRQSHDPNFDKNVLLAEFERKHCLQQ